MKSFNKNSLVFAFAMIFVIAGIFSKIGSIFENVRNNLDEIFSQKLNYHAQMMDINSIKDNLLGMKVVVSKNVVKTDSGKLVQLESQYTSDEIHKTVLRIAELQSVAENMGANFLYCAVPHKSYYENVPENVFDYEKQNYEEFVRQLGTEKISHIDMVPLFRNDKIQDNDLYYRTDHHWKSTVGFVAAKHICEELNKRYGFSYEKEFTDIDNYTVTTFPKLFLGAYGKKVGTYFTWKGADDFDLITPNFDSDILYEDPPSTPIKQGSFDDVLLNKDYLIKDYYHKINYNVYMPAKHHIRSFKNNLADNEKAKMLVVRTSYAQVVTPFLILQNKETYVCDVRNNQGYEGDKGNLKEYIESLKPNYVLVLYDGVYSVNYSDQRYNFF